MAKERRYTYFLCATGGDPAYTNEILAKNIDGENATEGLLCADGKKRDMWVCPSGKVFMIWASRHNWGKDFRIRVFCQQGKGKIRDVTGKPPFPYGKPADRRKKPRQETCQQPI